MDSTLMYINKGNAHGTQGNAPTGLNFQHSRLLRYFTENLSLMKRLLILLHLKTISVNRRGEKRVGAVALASFAKITREMHQ